MEIEQLLSELESQDFSGKLNINELFTFLDDVYISIAQIIQDGKRDPKNEVDRISDIDIVKEALSYMEDKQNSEKFISNLTFLNNLVLGLAESKTIYAEYANATISLASACKIEAHANDDLKFEQISKYVTQSNQQPNVMQTYAKCAKATESLKKHGETLNDQKAKTKALMLASKIKKETANFKSMIKTPIMGKLYKERCLVYSDEARETLSDHRSNEWLRLTRKIIVAVLGVASLGIVFGLKGLYSYASTGSFTIFDDKTLSAAKADRLGNEAVKLADTSVKQFTA